MRVRKGCLLRDFPRVFPAGPTDAVRSMIRLIARETRVRLEYEQQDTSKR